MSLACLVCWCLATLGVVWDSWKNTANFTTPWATGPWLVSPPRSSSSTTTFHSSCSSPGVFWTRQWRSSLRALWFTVCPITEPRYTNICPRSSPPLTTTTCSWEELCSTLVQGPRLSSQYQLCLVTRGEITARQDLRENSSWGLPTLPWTTPTNSVPGRTWGWWRGSGGSWSLTPRSPGLATMWSTRTVAPGHFSSSTPRQTGWFPGSSSAAWWVRWEPGTEVGLWGTSVWSSLPMWRTLKHTQRPTLTQSVSSYSPCNLINLVRE